MGKGKISDKQTEILEYIKEEQLKKGYPPSVREICKAVGLKSTSSSIISIALGFVGSRLIYPFSSRDAR